MHKGPGGTRSFPSVDLSHLPPRRALFVLEYAKDLHARNAAVRAGYSAHSAAQIATELMADADVKAAIEASLAERAKEVKVDAEWVLRELLRIATADPNDIVQHRRVCCRHCWGAGYGYQRTQREMDRDRAQHRADQDRKVEEAERAGKSHTRQPFDEAGGVGYRANREPNTECPECFGEGLGDVFVKDTRLLAAEPRALYAGVKRTKDGLEVKTHDKRAVLELIGRHIGMFTDKVEVTGKVELAQAITAARHRAKGQCPLV